MKKKRIAIVEDEMINAETLHDMVEDLGYEVYGKFMRAEKAWEAFQKDQPDFALLDIRLKGEETGIWLAGKIKKQFDFPYIYLTSFGDKKTIDDAAKTNAFGYLMKPVEKQNLHAAIEVALHKNAAISDQKPIEKEKEDHQIVIDDALFIKDEYYYSKIMLSEILYVKSDDNYLEIHTKQKKHLVRGSLKGFSQRLPKEQFIQVHRSYIINISATTGIGANFIKIGDDSIPISKNYQSDIRNYFNIY